MRSKNASYDLSVDVLIHQIAASGLPKIDSSDTTDYSHDVLTTLVSLAGLPAISIPIGNDSDGFPQGASIVSQYPNHVTVDWKGLQKETSNQAFVIFSSCYEFD